MSSLTPANPEAANPSARAVQRLRMRYAKRGRIRFTSHRDIARTFERALRRAGAPMAYSQGFNPHPKVSWVSAAPTGVASEAEYVEIGLVERVDPAALAKALDESLPPGLDILDIVEAVSGGSSLSERIDATEFSLELPGITPEELTAAVERLLSATSVEVERLTKNGRRPLDVRPAIVSAQVEVGTDTSEAATQQDVRSDTSAKSVSCGILRAVVRQTTPTVRPDDVLSALAVVADLHPPVPAKATRLGQGRLDDRNRLIDPLAQDRG